MKILDFASSDMKTALKIISSFDKVDLYRAQRILAHMKNEPPDRLMRLVRSSRGCSLLDDGAVDLAIRGKATLRVHLQNNYFILSFDLSARKDPTFDCLLAMVLTAKATDRRDLPVKVDKGDTITIKAAIAIAALVVAQESDVGSSGILWDMARDREI